MKSKKVFLSPMVCICFCLFSCSETSPNNAVDKLEDPISLSLNQRDLNKKSKTFPIYGDTIRDQRDGEKYATVVIEGRTWFAENLRFDAEASMLNPDNPSASYGRLYTVIAAQTACPKGWHIPSNREWDILEMAHGMPAGDTAKGGWRGEHAANLKSGSAWDDNGNGVNTLGFNVLPAGYFFSGNMGGERGIHGLGYSAAFWSSRVKGVASARFMFSPRNFVNKWDDTDDDTGAALSCRCVKD
jgi:uncharacterized protein (TIGR02145 family)